ncbi:hypothetical protein HOY80DRAFT_736722 [Tuber brumale]|nr:hypothetical protein HOY80DRAFT_736722 [Tuber brumale]
MRKLSLLHRVIIMILIIKRMPKSSLRYYTVRQISLPGMKYTARLSLTPALSACPSAGEREWCCVMIPGLRFGFRRLGEGGSYHRRLWAVLHFCWLACWYSYVRAAWRCSLCVEPWEGGGEDPLVMLSYSLGSGVRSLLTHPRMGCCRVSTWGEGNEEMERRIMRQKNQVANVKFRV